MAVAPARGRRAIARAVLAIEVAVRARSRVCVMHPAGSPIAGPSRAASNGRKDVHNVRITSKFQSHPMSLFSIKSGAHVTFRDSLPASQPSWVTRAPQSGRADLQACEAPFGTRVVRDPCDCEVTLP